MDSQTNTTKTTPQQEISKICSRNNAHGKYVVVKTKVMGVDIFKGCPKCIIEQKAFEKKEENRKKSIQFKDLLAASKIPKRFIKNDLKDFKTTPGSNLDEIKKAMIFYVDNFTKILKFHGTSLILSGKVGTGKTHIACAIGTGLIYQSERVLFVTVFEIMSNIKATYSKNSKITEMKQVEYYSTFPFLIIDEIGVQHGSNNDIILLTEIINRRYAEELPTILITNLNEEDLKKEIGVRIVDRFYENEGGLHSFNGESHRRK